MDKHILIARCTGKSMLPLFSHGAIAMIDTKEKTIHIGSLVYVSRGTIDYIHRVIHVNPTKKIIETRGDNSMASDGWVGEKEIRGRAILFRCHNKTIYVNRRLHILLGRIFSIVSRQAFRSAITTRIYRRIIRHPFTHSGLHLFV